MKHIGIVGGGQLGRMLTQAATQMGIAVTVIDPVKNCPASQVGAKQILASLTDKKAIRELAKQTDCLTFEIEHIDTEVLIDLANSGVSINPHPETLHMIKDKLGQKKFLKNSAIPTPRFHEINNPHDVLVVAKAFHFPLMLKTRFGGYDGRGNAIVRDETELAKALEKLKGKELYAEQFVPFSKEIAVMVARSTKGDIAVYPVTETIHKNNICHMTLTPAPIDHTSYRKAQELARQIMQHLHGAGVFGIEMFLLENGEVIVNEIAPRVHNSGHYTIEACKTSQFTQHVLAITEQDLESTDMIVRAAAMINILGERTGLSEAKGTEKAEKIPGVSVHLYGKTETRPERKMGHITATAETLELAEENAIRARELIRI